MKKKLILIVAVICIGLQSNVSICAENKQSWTEWFKSKLFGPGAQARSSRIVSAYAKAGTAASAAYLATPYPGLGAFYERSIGLPALVVTTYVFAFYSNLIIGEILHYANGGDKAVAVQKIKDSLILVLADRLLYPTRSSKINVLVKKDEFLAYVNDQDSLLQDACSQLLKEINAIAYSDAQYAEDQKIDGYIDHLKAQIVSIPTIGYQIAELERMQDQQKTIAQMQGYLSLYFRLKNQLELEKQLTPEQKMVREKGWSGIVRKEMKQQELERLEAEQGRKSQFVAPEWKAQTTD